MRMQEESFGVMPGEFEDAGDQQEQKGRGEWREETARESDRRRGNGGRERKKESKERGYMRREGNRIESGKRKERSDLSESRRLKEEEEEDEGRSEQATLMELLRYECWNMEIHTFTERVMEAHHKHTIHTLWMYKQTSTHSLSFKLLFCY